MLWVMVLLATMLVAAIALVAVGRVTAQLHETVAPALLEVDDAVEVIAEAIPFEVSAAISHADVDQIVRWVLDWFDTLGMASEFGEEVGGDDVVDLIDGDIAVADELGAADYAVARAQAERTDLDALHVTVVVDALLAYLRDIGAVGDEVG